MGALTRGFDWAATPLGTPDGWPQGLRTSIRMLLNTHHPMVIWWGTGLIQFYNDAYSLTMGPARHPSGLGQTARECWAEMWDMLGPQIEFVMAGRGATWHDNQLVLVTLNGRREERWWTYGLSPIDDPTQPGGIGGVLVVCNDVSEAHLARATLRLSEGRLRQALTTTEERLRVALDAAAVGTWDWDIPNGRIYGDAHLALTFGFDSGEAAAGLPLARFLSAIHPEDRRRVEARIRQTVESGDNYEAEYRTVDPVGALRWVVVRGRVRRDAAGNPLRFSGAVVDITEIRGVKAALHASEARRHASETQRFGLFEKMHEGFLLAELVHDAAGVAEDYRYLEINPAYERLTGVTQQRAVGHTLREVFPGIEPGWIGLCARVVETGEPTTYLAWVAPLGRWFEVHVWRPEPGRFASLFTDVTERLAAEERQAILAREVDHRAKNALAVVQATLRLTRAADLPGFVRAVEGRVGALARAQTLLADDHWSGADLEALLSGELHPFLGAAGARVASPHAAFRQEDGPFATVDGPPVALPAGSAQPLAMAAHELATNAVKYRALSVPAGHIAVSWQLEQGKRPVTLLRLRWTETGGPSVAGPPERRGFGSRVLEATVRRQLGGSLSQQWEAAGLICEMEVPLRPTPEPAAASGHGVIATD